jgi:hypothetical protein
MGEMLHTTYDRERLALYVAGLLPDNKKEAEAVLNLASRLLPVLETSRAEHPEDYQDDDDGRE